MTVYASKIEAGRIWPESSFGADGTGTIGNFKHVPFREGTSKVTLLGPMESPAHVQQRVDGHPTRVHMPRSAVWEFETNAETFTTRADDTVAATQSWLGLLLQTWLGGVHLMTGTTISDAGAAQTDFDVAVSTTLRPGAAFGLARGDGGTLEVREIKSKSSDNIVPKHYFSNAPANSDVVYGSATYYANPRTTGAEFQSLQAIVEGYTLTDRYVLLGGGVANCEPIVENGRIARLKWTLEFAGWYPADGVDVSADLDGAIIGAASYADVNTLVQADSEFCAAIVGTANSVSKLHVSAMSFVPAIRYAKIMTPGGLNNVAGWVRTHVSPCLEIKFTVPYEDQTWFNYRESRTPLALWHQIGSSPTRGAFVISAPNCQVVDVQRADVDGIAAHEVTAVARHDTDTTAETGYEGLAQSAFRIHQL